MGKLRFKQIEVIVVYPALASRDRSIWCYSRVKHKFRMLPTEKAFAASATTGAGLVAPVPCR